MAEAGYLNLPWPILVHSVGLTALGLSMAFSPTPNKTPDLRGANSMLGIATATIGLCYIGTSGVPIQQNQFLYASVPVRLFIAVLLASAGTINRRIIGEKSWRTHMGFALWDGAGALWLGWYLGTWDGKCPST
ncbi:hypothetical protein TWF694_007193 [Orbilia ellipsospora]|uniref:Uncharacterized protein n=1 Tax=Orbilia ellipsospora TaxID=2528407 RepID=A0AAV9XHX9_9PEZI